jgi:hypothetical protein
MTMKAGQKTFSHLIVLALLLVFLFQCFFSMTFISSTSDEVAHLPAGYTYLKTGDFKLNPEHPPLVKIISAYPLLFLALPHPYTNSYFMNNEKWEYGKSLIYWSGESAEKILFLGRMMIVFLGLFLALLLYSWTKELFGPQASLFSLFLFSLEPNLIAHSRLITTDVAFSLFFLLTIYWMWKYFQRPSNILLVLCGLSCGLAFATKFSAVLLCPIILILFAVELFLFHKEARSTKVNVNQESTGSLLSLYGTRSLKAFFSFLIAVPLMTFLVLAASYGFLNLKYYFIGLKSVFIHSKMGHASFLAGQYADTGWWYYFPLAYLLKTPIPLLIFLFAFLLLFFHYLFDVQKKVFLPKKSDSPLNPGFHRIPWRNWMYLFLPPLLFLSASIMSRLNIGLRHILPAFPFAIILCGLVFKKSIMESLRWKKLLSFVFFLLCLWYMVGSFFIFPHYLSYFNEFIGGPKNGYKYFVDSNLDWGQDMPALKNFLEEKNIDGVILAYFGNADPYYYGIEYQYLPLCGKAKIPLNYRPPDKDFDYIAISATHLQAVFTFDHQCFQWLKERKPLARIAHSLFLYDIKGDAEAHRKLAENYHESNMYIEAKKHILKFRTLTQQKKP